MSSWNSRLAIPLAAALSGALLTLGCKNTSAPGPAIYTLQVIPLSATISVGDSIRLVARAYDVHTVLVENAGISFQSDSPTVASVTSAGVVRGLALGASSIEVSAVGLTKDVTVVVVGPPYAIRVAPQRPRLLAGDTVTLSTTVVDAAGHRLSGVAVAYRTADAAVATVSAAGLVSAVGAGTDSVTVTAGSLSKVVPVSVFSIVPSPDPLVVTLDSTAQLGVTVHDSTGAVVPSPGLTFGSADSTVATVSGTGLVSGIRLGATVIDVTYAGLTASAPVSVVSPTAGRPFGIAVSSKGLVYVTRLDANAVSYARLPGVSFNADSAIAVGAAPTDVAFNPAATTAYVANQLSPNVGVIDVASEREVDSIAVGSLGDPFRVLVSGDGQTLYLGTSNGTLAAINTATKSDSVMLTAPEAVNGLALAPGDSILYASSIAGIVYAIHLRSGTAVAYTIGGQPQEVVVSADGSKLYVANAAGSLEVLNAASGMVISQVPAVTGGFGAALSPDGSTLCVTTISGGLVQFVTLSTLAVRDTTVGGTPRRVVWDPTGTRAFVANEDGSVNIVH